MTLIIVDKGKIIFKNKGKDKLLDKDTSSIVFDFLYGNKQYYKSVFNKIINHINKYCSYTNINPRFVFNKYILIHIIMHDINHIKLDWRKCKFIYNCNDHYLKRILDLYKN